MKILVTGCAGFIGSSLCERLVAHQHEVIGIDNFDTFYDLQTKEQNLKVLKASQLFRFYELDITDKEAFNIIKEEFGVVIHLAAKAGVRPSIEDPSGYINTNIQGTLNVLDFMLRRNVHHIIFASSSSVYGDAAISPYKEDGITHFPISPYAFTKKSGELLLYTYHNLYRVSSISLRFFTVFGPRQRPDLAIHKFYNAIIQGLPITLYGDGSTSRDYTYIDDIVDGIEKALMFLISSDSVCEIFNLGNNTPVTLKNLVTSIEETINKEAVITWQPMQMGDVLHTCADITKAQNVLGYQPSTGFLEGLQKFHLWKKTQFLYPVL